MNGDSLAKYCDFLIHWIKMQIIASEDRQMVEMQDFRIYAKKSGLIDFIVSWDFTDNLIRLDCKASELVIKINKQVEWLLLLLRLQWIHLAGTVKCKYSWTSTHWVNLAATFLRKHFNWVELLKEP